MPGTVSDVSATLVDSTMRRPRCDWKMRCCSTLDSRAYSGSTSVSRQVRPAQRVGGVVDLALAADRNTSTSPGPSLAQLVDGVAHRLHLIALVVVVPSGR